MNIGKIYLRTCIAFGVMTLLLVQFVNPRLPSIQRCLDRQAEFGGVAATSEMPNVVVYSAYKGLLWPVSLIWSVGAGKAPFGDWLLARYDPFPDACR